ncbi:MAG: hypothetical protein V4650_08065 [Pseudomonadota bacterium]
MRYLAIVLSALLACGCATSTELQISSEPPGAYISELGSGRSIGVAPVSSFYESEPLRAFKDSNGCFLVKGVVAQWVSGARTSTTDPIRLCGKLYGVYNITASRDSSEPNLEKDLQFAMQLQLVQAQQQQAQAAKDAAAAALIQLFDTNQKSSNAVSCSSYSLGSTVQTNCR